MSNATSQRWTRWKLVGGIVGGVIAAAAGIVTIYVAVFPPVRPPQPLPPIVINPARESTTLSIIDAGLQTQVRKARILWLTYKTDSFYLFNISLKNETGSRAANVT